MEQVHRAIQTSFWCIQEHPSQRPTMGKVLQMLEGVTEIENPPALKSVAEATSTFFTGNVSIISTVAGSPPGHYSSSSFTPRTTERATSALLRSDSS
ncbi:hypothetical protein L6164_007045 [Bauhinia variegata]|uniref:Uncharacterized protein n=1 Tax=Bauhinia variegata TaxID=167791 RepID=A0ACB9PZ28_BAUVA|nr:hypothetical protein L6164_007045 [Bauhinia variegata]